MQTPWSGSVPRGQGASGGFALGVAPAAEATSAAVETRSGASGR